MKQALLTILRNEATKRPEYRLATQHLAMLLAAEVADHIPTEPVKIKTPVTETIGQQQKGGVVLVPILRAGLALLGPFMDLFPYSKVGFIGIRRDEKTAAPHLYYHNLPKINFTDTPIVLDPMIATGGSGELAVNLLVGTGADISRLVFAGVIGSRDGIERIQRMHPHIKIIVAGIDPELSPAKMIVPGLGDFGDRYFGTETEI